MTVDVNGYKSFAVAKKATQNGVVSCGLLEAKRQRHGWLAIIQL